MPRRTENAEQKIAGVKFLKIGVKNILIGVALIGGAGILLYLFFGRPNIVGMNIRTAEGFGIMLLAGFYGIWKLVNGIVYLVCPQSEKESITGIS